MRARLCIASIVCALVPLAGAHAAGAAGWSLRWDGHRWTIQSIPDPSRSVNASLVGVSCPSSSSCTAVGSYINRAQNTATLAERWDGRRWSLQTVRDPRGTRRASLDGVSCSSSAACAAVGSYLNSRGATVTLAARYS